MSPEQASPGNGLLLFFRVDDFDMVLERARALGTRFEEEPHVNPNTRTREFSLRDPNGYYVTMSALPAPQREGPERRRPMGWPAVIPRIAVDDPEALVAFIQHVFGALGRFRPARPTELRIGDSIVMVGVTVARRAMPAFLYVYVEDTDRVFLRALDRGAESLEEPQDMPYGDRRAMVRDPWDNTWQIATHRGWFTR